MIKSDNRVIRFALDDVPPLPELMQTSGSQTPELEGWRPLGAEW